MKVQQIFFPGDKWLYIKLYTNESLGDTIIRLVFHKIQLYKKDISCFFIRYNDPDFHLRFRFLLSSEALYCNFFMFITNYMKKLWKDKLIWKIQIDSYERELCRYNTLPIELTEQHFCIESLFIYKYLCFSENIVNHFPKHKLAFFIINKYIQSTGIDLASTIHYFHQLSLAYKTEFRFNEFNSKSINSMYRKNKGLIEQSIENSTIMIDPCISNLLNNFIANSCQYLKKLGARQDDKNFPEHLFSLIHMFLNRLFSTKNRLHELIIYEFLFRYYNSLKVRIQNNNITTI